MRHKWTIIQEKKLTDAKKCRVCGCVRHNYFGTLMYLTSGGHSYAQAPDCIDWEVENAKTID